MDSKIGWLALTHGGGHWEFYKCEKGIDHQTRNKFYGQ